MSLSRSEKERRLPTLSLKRWLVLITGFVVFVIVTFVLYIRSADSEYRKAESKAAQIAQKQGGLVEVSEAVRHTWDETVWVVTGLDSENQTWMIWERKEELIKRKVNENKSEKQMLSIFTQEHAGVTPIRMIPGWFQDQPIWEIRYKINSGDGQQSIDFYSFKDGTKLKTYVLSSQ
jgi:uncharacterized protein YpmB